MVTTPLFSDPQFVDAAGPGGLNAAFVNVANSLALLAGEFALQPGLLQPEVLQISSNAGLLLNVIAPAPFGIMTSGGVVATAHGTQTNQDTQSYLVDFSPLVPGSGSTTAYLAATPLQIQQTPVPIPGPPPGHASFNPNYQPTIGYTAAVDSLSMTATLTAPDNVSTFELARLTLTAGSGQYSGFSTDYQHRVSFNLARPTLQMQSSSALTAAQLARFTIAPAAPNLTTTLPPATACVGTIAVFYNEQTNWTIAANGTDTIQTGRTGAASATIRIATGGALILRAGRNGIWQTLGLNAAQYTSLLPAAPLLGFSGTDFNVIGIGTGLQLLGGVLSAPLLPPPVAPLLGSSGSGFNSISVGNGLRLAGNVLSAPNLVASSATQVSNSPQINIPVNQGYTNLQSMSFTFPPTSPTGAFKLFIMCEVTWSAILPPSPPPISLGTVPLLVFDQTNNAQTLFPSSSLIVAGNAGAGGSVAVSDFSTEYYSPGTTIVLIQMAALTGAAYPLQSINVIGTLHVTSIPA